MNNLIISLFFFIICIILFIKGQTPAPSPKPTPAPTTYYTPVLNFTMPYRNLTYWCRPVHYLGGPQGSWQRVDGGIRVNTTVNIEYVKVWIDKSEFNQDTDDIGMIQNEYEKSIFGFKQGLGNEIKIEGLPGVSTTSEDWTRTLRFVGFRIKTLAEEDSTNLCIDYVDKYIRTIHFQVCDSSGGCGNIYKKGVEVKSATMMYTDLVVTATDAAAGTSLGMPATFDASIKNNFTLTLTSET